MKKYIETLFKAFISFVFLVFVIISSWSLVVTMIATLDKSLSSADKTLVLAIISALVSIISIYITKALERSAAEFADRKKEMQPRYENLLQKVLSDNIDRKAIKNEFLPFIASHATNEVYNAFVAFCDEVDISSDRVVLAIRKELKLASKKSN